MGGGEEGQSTYLVKNSKINFVLQLQIVAEKQKFRKTPFNYAQKKNNLMRSKVCTNKMIISCTTLL